MSGEIESNVELPEDFDVRFKIDDSAILKQYSDLYGLNHQGLMGYVTHESKTIAVARLNDDLKRLTKRIAEIKAAKLKFENELSTAVAEHIVKQINPEQRKKVKGNLDDLVLAYVQKNSEPDFDTKELVLRDVQPAFFYVFNPGEKKKK